ncbi:hypothetical protein D3C79_494010 [compost metagenome]
MQLVMLQQDRRRLARVALVAAQLSRLPEPSLTAVVEGHAQRAATDRVRLGGSMRSTVERDGLVEEVPGEGNDLGATDRVVGIATPGAVGFADGIGAVQRVIQRTPAGIRGVERVARVAQRYDQLRTGLHGDLAVDLGGADAHRLGNVDQIADAAQEALVGGHVGDRTGVLAVPGVQFRLQAFAFGEQLTVARCQVVDQGAETVPERLGIDAGPRQHFIFDETLQDGGHLKRASCGVSHGLLVSCTTSRKRLEQN